MRIEEIVSSLDEEMVTDLKQVSIINLKQVGTKFLAFLHHFAYKNGHVTCRALST